MAEPDTKTAFVTGAASGIGLAVAERLTRGGFSIFVADIDSGRAEEVAARLGGTPLHCDVGDLDSVRRAADEAGDVDLLVNNAGFDRPGLFLASDPRDWADIVRVVMMGVLNCTFALAPGIVRRAGATGYGRIVNVASDAGRVGSLGEAAYSAAKGGVIAFSKSMARELARDGVTVNAVCPGPADTPMTAALRQSELGEKIMQGMIRATPLHRLVQPEEVAGAVAYFASEEAGFTTGQVLSVSGGLTMSG
ncbi:MAG TPA: SDR family oxidoreductase [Actinomycetota bacterium]|jgi:2-hydroxycyclohexanecarboxyl-CoA dehydrogenase|nr:SDR family oxidoreductase [Actinomycetota bacterium]